MPNTGKTLMLQVRMPAFLVIEALEKDTHVSPTPLPAFVRTLTLSCRKPRADIESLLGFPQEIQ